MSPRTPVERLVAHGARIHFHPEVPRALATEWLRGRTHWFGAARQAVLGAEGQARLVRLDSPLGPLVAKREQRSPWEAGLASVGALRSRSARAFALGRAFREAGLATPEPVAWIEARFPRSEAILVLRHETGADPWRFLAGRASGAVLEALARAIADLHSRGFRHRDLKAPNLLLAEEEGAIRVTFLDLDGAARVPHPSPATRARDLARLAASFRSAAARQAGLRADAWPALIEAYLAAAGDVLERTLLVERTQRWASVHVEHNLRRGRPIA